MSAREQVFRRAPLTSVFLVSECSLLVAPMILDAPVIGGIVRVLLIPAYGLILLASWVVPWTGHWPLVLTVFVALGMLDVGIQWARKATVARVRENANTG